MTVNMQGTDILPGSYPQNYHYNIMNSNRAHKPFARNLTRQLMPPPPPKNQRLIHLDFH